MKAKTTSIKRRLVRLVTVSRCPGFNQRSISSQQYKFTVNDISPETENTSYCFSVTEQTAQLVADSVGDFPFGATMKISGRLPPEGDMTHVSIHSVEGTDLQGWAQRNGSVGVDSSVLAAAQDNVSTAAALEELMRSRSPGDGLQRFKSLKHAHLISMEIVRRHMRSANPVLTKDEILVMRDALNTLYEGKLDR